MHLEALDQLMAASRNQKKINVWICSSAAVWDLVNGSETGSGVGRDCRSNDLESIMIGKLEAARKKLESRAKPDGSKSEVKVKKEEMADTSAVTPSPNKKLATEYERKMKNMEGDLRLVKVWRGVYACYLLCY